MLQVPGVPVTNWQGSPRGENASVQVLSQGVPELVSIDEVYALGFVPVGAPEAAVIIRARSIDMEVPAV